MSKKRILKIILVLLTLAAAFFVISFENPAGNAIAGFVLGVIFTGVVLSDIYEK